MHKIFVVVMFLFVAGLFYFLGLNQTHLQSKKWSTVAESGEFYFRYRETGLPLNNPDYVETKDASHMRDDDLVIGIKVGTQFRAYPWWILSNYHIVNDTIDRKPLFVSLCEACSGSSAFFSYIEQLDLPLSFHTCGSGKATIAICDYETNSRWHPFLGEAESGRHKGATLKRIPIIHLLWRDWKAQYPNSEVLLAGKNMRLREHGLKGGNKIGNPGMSPGLRKSANLKDTRLKRYTVVFGISDGDDSLALTLKHRESGLYSLSINNKKYVLVYRKPYLVLAYEEQLDNVPLTLKLKSQMPILFTDQLGNTWNVWGEAIDGPNKNAQLALAKTAYLTEWYEWVTAFPKTRIDGKKPGVKGLSDLPGNSKN